MPDLYYSIERFKDLKSYLSYQSEFFYRFRRMIRGQIISYNEAKDIIVELLHHLEFNDIHRLMEDLYNASSEHLQRNTVSKNLEKYKMEMEMEMTKRYKFYVDKLGKFGKFEVIHDDETTKELDELLGKDDFINEKEMEL
jgi:hypothetical protein